MCVGFFHPFSLCPHLLLDWSWISLNLHTMQTFWVSLKGTKHNVNMNQNPCKMHKLCASYVLEVFMLQLLLCEFKYRSPFVCPKLCCTHPPTHTLSAGGPLRAALSVGGLSQVEERKINTRPAQRNTKERWRENKGQSRDKHLPTRCAGLDTEPVCRIKRRE